MLALLPLQPPEILMTLSCFTRVVKPNHISRHISTPLCRLLFHMLVEVPNTVSRGYRRGYRMKVGMVQGFLGSLLRLAIASRLLNVVCSTSEEYRESLTWLKKDGSTIMFSFSPAVEICLSSSLFVSTNFCELSQDESQRCSNVATIDLSKLLSDFTSFISAKVILVLLVVILNDGSKVLSKSRCCFACVV